VKHYKNLGIGFERVGGKAYMVSHVWRLGPHMFSTSDGKIFRICYARMKGHTYYWQLEINKHRRVDAR
jgi:hypothetical protein